MRLKPVDNGTGSFVFVMDDEPVYPLAVNGRWFHRSLDEAVANAARIGCVVGVDLTVVTDDQHHAAHRTHAVTVGNDGVNRCECGTNTYNMVGRTALDLLLSEGGTS